jgi:hypothetical protein
VTARRLNGADAAGARVDLSFVVRHGRGRRLVDRRVMGAGARPRISGRLTTIGGVPLGGARVWRASAVADGTWQISGAPLTTSTTGHVSGRLPAHGPSRDMRLVYFSYSDSSENVQPPARRLRVRAATTIRLDNIRYLNGETMNFSGRITTRPLIRRKPVDLQVVVRGRWRTFDTTRGLGGSLAAALSLHRDPAPHRAPVPSCHPHRRGKPLGSGTFASRANLGHAMRSRWRKCGLDDAFVGPSRLLGGSNTGGSP